MIIFYFVTANESKYVINMEMVTISSMDILKWLTGASRIPAVGLDVVKIFFTSDTVLPRVNTCAIAATIQRPRHFYKTNCRVDNR